MLFKPLFRINPAHVTSVQFGQTVLLLKFRIS